MPVPRLCRALALPLAALAALAVAPAAAHAAPAAPACKAEVLQSSLLSLPLAQLVANAPATPCADDAVGGALSPTLGIRAVAIAGRTAVTPATGPSERRVRSASVDVTDLAADLAPQRAPHPAMSVDVSDDAAVRAMVADLADRFGRLDAAVNCAATVTLAPIAELDDADWRDMVATNLSGTLSCLRHEIVQMIDQGSGVIVNVGSTIGAHHTVPQFGGYAATKAAVAALTRTAAREYAPRGVRINCVSPGPVATPSSRRPGETDTDRDARVAAMLPAGRVGLVADVAEAVRWLASPAAAFIVGTDLVVDGGSTA